MLNYFKINKNKGFTLIELLIVFVVIAIISSIVVLSLSKFRNEQALKNTTIDIVSLLNKARQNTLSSVNSMNYSVHFEEDKTVLFIGNTYVEGDPTNEEILFTSVVNIPTTGGINISGGGNEINFERLTGEVTNGTNSSTIVVQQVSDSTKQKTITINKIGVISSN